jgi:hypothetical protein
MPNCLIYLLIVCLFIFFLPYILNFLAVLLTVLIGGAVMLGS